MAEYRCPTTTQVQAMVDATKLNGLTVPDGAVDFSQQQATSLVIENRTSDPSSPVSGQMWLRTDL